MKGGSHSPSPVAAEARKNEEEYRTNMIDLRGITVAIALNLVWVGLSVRAEEGVDSPTESRVTLRELLGAGGKGAGANEASKPTADARKQAVQANQQALAEVPSEPSESRSQHSFRDLLSNTVRQASDSIIKEIRPDADASDVDPFQDDEERDVEERDAEIRPKVLRDPLEPAHELPRINLDLLDDTNPLYVAARDAPYGFTGPSGVLPTEHQTSSHFIPVEDRWRLGQPDADRYGKGHPLNDDYLGVEGAFWDPYNQNVLKGDYPIIGQHTFLKLQGKSLTLLEGRQLPTPTTPFEATRNPGAVGFFGDPDSFLAAQYTSFAVELFHGNTSFKPNDWRLRLNLVHNVNHLVADELGVVSPDVRAGTSRHRDDFALEEWFFESKISDLSPYYDFASVRVGSQPFVSDFRGFIFADINRGVRLFGTRHSNRDQFNLMWFDQTEKETNSLLNVIDDDRNQNTWIANYYRQDFLYPGNTASVSFHANHDRASFEFDENNFLVRPDPVGVFQPHDVRSYYFGVANNGHMERINVSSAFYYVFGRDELNPIAGREVDISAYMAAIELSYDRDWVRFRTSYLFNSGDSDTNDDKATGFDAIFANPNFAGNEFSYWGRQGIRLFGVELTNRLSLNPSMRQSKFQGQTNFVNPGLHLFNLGLDADITPRLKTINNCNFLWFEDTSSLETYLFTGEVHKFIGTDISTGLEYRPLLNNNILLLGGLATLIGGNGLEDLYQNLDGELRNHVAGFLELVLEF